MEFATRTIHAAQPSEPGTGSLIAPIFQTSTYEQDEPGSHRGFDYSRTNNPTRARLEAVLADLEGVQHCATFASGLAAENAVLQAWLKPGDEIVIPQDVYGGTYRILTRVFQPLGCVITQIDVGDTAALATALASRPKLVWIESPTNPRLLVYDIAAICAAAHGAGALVVVDNTFATPLFQQPFALGAACCELVKDVPGYFTADPKRDPYARPLPSVSFARAIQMADEGCELVQRHALVAARDRALPLVIRALGSHDATIVN